MNEMMLSFGGCKEFDAAQRAFCTCVTQDKVEPQRKRALKAFYKKHVTDTKADVPALFKKHGKDAAKFAKLMNKLVKKYPASVKVVKSKQQQMMDDILNNPKYSEDVKQAGDADEAAADDTSGPATPADNDDGDIEVVADDDDETPPHDEM